MSQSTMDTEVFSNEYGQIGLPRIARELCGSQIAGVPWISWEFQRPITFEFASEVDSHDLKWLESPLYHNRVCNGRSGKQPVEIPR